MLVRVKLIEEKQKNFFFVSARSGSRSSNMSFQVDHFIYLLQNKSICDWKNDWKMITIFVGVSQM